MDKVELLVGIAEIAIALAGFTGIVVAFGSRSHGSWHPGDRLRLAFLLEASLTAASFSLLSLLLLSTVVSQSLTWAALSGLWAVYMSFSLWWSHKKIENNAETHGDIDKLANRVTGLMFFSLVVVQILNTLWWQEFPPFLAAIILNLAGAAMQFSRLIRSAFHD